MNKYRIEYIEIDRWGEKDFNWLVIEAESEDEAMDYFYDETRMSSIPLFNSIEKIE